jgi:hypothetical protein
MNFTEIYTLALKGAYDSFPSAVALAIMAYGWMFV